MRYLAITPGDVPVIEAMLRCFDYVTNNEDRLVGKRQTVFPLIGKVVISYLPDEGHLAVFRDGERSMIEGDCALTYSKLPATGEELGQGADRRRDVEAVRRPPVTIVP